jgi:hypothetical protein
MAEALQDEVDVIVARMAGLSATPDDGDKLPENAVVVGSG